MAESSAARTLYHARHAEDQGGVPGRLPQRAAAQRVPHAAEAAAQRGIRRPRVQDTLYEGQSKLPTIIFLRNLVNYHTEIVIPLS